MNFPKLVSSRYVTLTEANTFLNDFLTRPEVVTNLTGYSNTQLEAIRQFLERESLAGASSSTNNSSSRPRAISTTSSLAESLTSSSSPNKLRQFQSPIRGKSSPNNQSSNQPVSSKSSHNNQSSKKTSSSSELDDSSLPPTKRLKHSRKKKS
jgi:hypothetical protein